uniref:Uncharacterized protein n=1 Tax=Romanomermis culicivorax TaxID=13658 RepID=A0A915K0T9_ROMCU
MDKVRVEVKVEVNYTMLVMPIMLEQNVQLWSSDSGTKDLVCRSGGGKSQAYSNFLENPLEEIEQSKRLPQLVYQNFTSSGLMRAIKDAEQHLIWVSDEFGAGLIHALNPKDKEWCGFWATLNSFILELA